ncbi:hypothetical protein [Saccharothrix variisporea]|uniref:Uncharacterized protein n=1 Tax=Saccharothrix variisporea TaxID=543527 RepID=A0A495XI98_9PSEU|nr:hypothetical protein [Saccharothrix variisporea]RKT72845.1 hypothetical protein DFJ66_6169 [Saccharothrix variisporea]
MQTWVYGVLFAAVLIAIALVVDRRARAKRAGLERPADTRGRSKADPVSQARIDNPGAAGIAERVEGRGGSNLGSGV